MTHHQVYIAPAADYARTLREALDWLGAAAPLGRAGGVFVKPNLTYPRFQPGVTTTPEMIEAALTVLRQLHPRVVVGESDGGYGSFAIRDAFENFGLFRLGRRLGVEVVNLSQTPTRPVRFALPRGDLTLELPRFLLDEGFVTVTLPVPKVHCMTGVSLSYKNQWGCIPDMMRLRLHYYFNDLIGPLNEALRVRLALVDGAYGLTKNGPIAEGLAVQPGWLVCSRSPGAADRVTAHLMGLRLEDYAHYRAIHRRTPLPRLAAIATNTALEPYLRQTPRFYLKRHFWNYVAKTTWYSRRWGYLVYESPLADLLHRIMYTFRERPRDFQAPPPPASRHDSN